MRWDRLPGVLLRIEGLAVLLGATVLYVDADYSWLAFVLLFLAPDRTAFEDTHLDRALGA